MFDAQFAKLFKEIFGICASALKKISFKKKINSRESGKKRECAGHFANFPLLNHTAFSIVWSVKHSRLLPDEKHIERKRKTKKSFSSVKGNFFFLWHMWILTTFDSVFTACYVPVDFFLSLSFDY